MNTTVQGIHTSYTDTGTGKVIVALHGWGTNKENLAELCAGLSDSFRVIALDLPGFGSSEVPPPTWAVADYAQFVHDFLAQLDIGTVHAFIGHSFGGRICLKGLSTHLLLAQRLILIGSAGVKKSASFRNVLFMLIAKAGKGAARLPFLASHYKQARQALYAKAGSTDYLNAGPLEQVFKNVVSEDLRSAARHVTVPTLLIWGSEDTETPLSDARFFHQAITGSQLRIIQGASHFVHTEHPKKVLRWAQEFLA